MSRTLRIGSIAGIVAVGVALTFAVTTSPAADAHGVHDAGKADKSGKVDTAAFHDAMRKLWEDHVVWTRQFIVSATTESGNLADIGPTTDRLLANQADIGNALKPFYGDAAGAQVTALLRDHILTAAGLVAAAKAGDAAGVEATSAAWYQNASDISVALNGLNPKHWSLDEMQAHMKDHLDLTLAEAVARLQGRYADDIAAYDQIHVQILGMADMLSDGVIAQFPDRFVH